nr:hypothetical protein [Tanacetum cinerariifolium]
PRARAGRWPSGSRAGYRFRPGRSTAGRAWWPPPAGQIRQMAPPGRYPSAAGPGRAWLAGRGWRGCRRAALAQAQHGRGYAYRMGWEALK